MRLIHFFLIFNLHISICFGQKITREQRINAEMLLIKLRNSTDASDKLILSDKILQIDSSYTKAIAFKALAYYAKKDYQEALKFFNLYLAKKPNSSFCVYRSQLKLEIGDTLGALSDIEKAFFLSGYDDIISNQVSQFFGTDKRIEKYYEKVLELHPTNFIAHTVIGVLKEKQKDYKNASIHYNTAVKCIDNELFYRKRIENRWLYQIKSNLDFKLKRYNDAIEAISQSILLYPEDPSYYSDRINCYMLLGNSNKAYEDIFLLRKLSNTESLQYNYMKFDSTKIDTVSINNWLKNIEAEKLYIQGCKLQGNDTSKFKKAIYYYSKALEIKPNHVHALAERAYSYLLLNELNKEILDLDEILKISPKSAPVFNYRATAKRDLGNFKEGLEDINNAISIDSTNVEYFVTRASIKTRVGDTSNAIIDLTRAINLNPYYSVSYFEKALLELNFRKNAKAALNDNLKAIELEDNNPFSLTFATYHNNCAMTYNTLKLYDNALEQLEKAIAKRPNYPLYYFRCGEIKARMKDMEGACLEWNKAKQLGYQDAEELILYNCKPDSKDKR